ncbi:UDP-N-acetylmuramate--L-alanine ligase [Calderihabitans maritimus]|uniref:UDP-N-acetylmuramate--L-alanine ligase n=1 Tax=Calderihabitans maritimus TaxID=1246530 RepID=A0A1Z5HRI7_9FIRM|nr:UDP-N-acetylmuramate--L-alanine ligase [Calderihabitans maritimus]GAW92143.1 UDP-N-acetylmuramate--L-alanine ligase [Calderihabitans maritimus]
MQKSNGWIHFVGIGGAGMSGIAKILLELGYQVSGSDLRASDITQRLEKLGARVYIGHRPDNVADNVTRVVVSSAIPVDNPEIQKAKDCGIPVMQRAEMLGWLMQRQKGIAVAGAHGKTTTTSMISLVLERNGLDPTLVVGGEVYDIGCNAKLGRGEYLVAEADESDGSFLKLKPEVAVVTNVENDHLDYYGSFERILEAFTRFVKLVPSHGFALLCTDDRNLNKLASSAGVPCLTYGLKGNPDFQAANVIKNGFETTADILYQGKKIGKVELQIPGVHNIINALAAVAVGMKLGIPFSGIAEALKTFRGVQRRFQLTGEVNGVRVVDDYAHHPTELKATLQAARQTGPRRVIAVFQPHRYTRTKFLHKEFGAAFSKADLVIVNQIYSAGEKPIPGVSAELIVEAIREAGQNVLYFEHQEDIVDFLAEHHYPGDLILTLGAGNIWKTGVELVKRLQSLSQTSTATR